MVKKSSYCQLKNFTMAIGKLDEWNWWLIQRFQILKTKHSMHCVSTYASLHSWSTYSKLSRQIFVLSCFFLLPKSNHSRGHLGVTFGSKLFDWLCFFFRKKPKYYNKVYNWNSIWSVLWYKIWISYPNNEDITCDVFNWLKFTTIYSLFYDEFKFLKRLPCICYEKYWACNCNKCDFGKVFIIFFWKESTMRKNKCS